MINKLNLELIHEIDCKNLRIVKLLTSSYDKVYQLDFKGVINFSYSIESDGDFSSDALDIINIEYIFDFPTKEILKFYSYKSDKSLYQTKLHYLFIYGDIELILLSKELYINELSKDVR